MRETSLFRTIMDNIDSGVYFVDLERRISLWNKAAERITGFSAAEALGHNCFDEMLDHVDMNGNFLCVNGCPLAAVMKDGQVRSIEILIRHKDGYRVPALAHAVPVFSDGKIVGAVEIFTPLSPLHTTPRVSWGEESMTDPLTGLPNRAYLEYQLLYRMQEARQFGSFVAVGFADIDNFTVFTSYYGQNTADTVLKNVASSYKNILQPEELIGRWDQDMFMGIFAVREADDPLVFAERMRMLVARSGVMFSGQQHIALTASVGFTVAQPGDTLETLLSRADIYLQQSKQRGKNCCTIDAPAP